MQNLRLVLIIIGILIVVSLLVHAYWLNRKERSSLFKSTLSEFKTEKNDEISQELPLEQLSEGVGKVTVIARQQTNDLHQYSVKKNYSQTGLYSQPKQGDLFKNESSHRNKAVVGVHSASFTKVQDEISSEAELALQVKNETVKSNAALYASSNKEEGDAPPSQVNTEVAESSSIKKVPTKIIALHVAALAGQYLSGEKLLASFEAAGLKFGTRNIFHYYFGQMNQIDELEREVIFSVANMIKPGEFQLNNMAQFITPGVTLFMLVPNIGDSQQSFKIMLQIAQRIADDVGGLVLDEERHLLSPQKITEYRQLIKSVLEQSN